MKAYELMQAAVAEIKQLEYERDVKRNQICTTKPRIPFGEQAAAIEAKPAVRKGKLVAVDVMAAAFETLEVDASPTDVCESQFGAGGSIGVVEPTKKFDEAEDFVVVEKEGSCETGVASARRWLL